MRKPSVGIPQNIDCGGRPWEFWVEIPGEENGYQVIILLLNIDEWQIGSCLIVFRSPKLGLENNSFLNEPIKNSFWENLSISFDLGSLQYSESQGIEGRDHLQVSRPKPRGVW